MDILDLDIDDLVCINIFCNRDLSTIKTWWKIIDILPDETIIAILERKPPFSLENYPIWKRFRWDISSVNNIFRKENSYDFCYTDNVTLCNCVALCKDK